jgi:Leucine-rich repeat (LRR) protein
VIRILNVCVVASPLQRVTKQVMGMQRGSLTVLLLVLLSTNAEDCANKNCFCNDNTIDCGFKGLTRMPPVANVTGAQRLLVLDYNNITEIPANSLPSNLSGIEMVNNPTTIIADTAFDGSLYTLQSISSTFALFTRIPNAFGHLRALKSLTIQNVNVQDWNEDAMRIGGQTLTFLDLDNVSLSSWPNWIQNCSQLTDLTITRSSIQYIPDGALDKVATSLTSLDLSNNNLTSIPKALSQLLALTSLSLEQNNIIDVTWLPQHSQLTSIALNNNRISNSHFLSDALCPMGSSLIELDIQYNQMTTIPDFTSMTKIGNLDFSHNKISDPFSGSILSNIYSVDLSYNFLPAIPRFVSTLYQATILNFPWNVITSFVGTDIPPSATLLDLGYNLITELTDNNFPNNSQLGSLHLNNNPIVIISNMAFTKLAVLTELNLQSSKLTRLPLALGSLTILTYLDLTDSNDLVCTCMEKGLESWMVKLSPYSVDGKCGVMGIYDFFSKLSPECPSQ